MAKERKHKPIDPATGKPVRAPRVALTDGDKARIVAERVKLGDMMSNNNLPESIRDSASKLLLLGNTQLLRRLEKSAR